MSVSKGEPSSGVAGGPQLADHALADVRRRSQRLKRRYGMCGLPSLPDGIPLRQQQQQQQPPQLHSDVQPAPVVETMLTVRNTITDICSVLQLSGETSLPMLTNKDGSTCADLFDFYCNIPTNVAAGDSSENGTATTSRGQQCEEGAVNNLVLTRSDAETMSVAIRHDAGGIGARIEEGVPVSAPFHTFVTATQAAQMMAANAETAHTLGCDASDNSSRNACTASAHQTFHDCAAGPGTKLVSTTSTQTDEDLVSQQQKTLVQRGKQTPLKIGPYTVCRKHELAPVKSIIQCLARKDGDRKMYILKIVCPPPPTLQPPPQVATTHNQLLTPPRVVPYNQQHAPALAHSRQSIQPTSSIQQMRQSTLPATYGQQPTQPASSIPQTTQPTSSIQQMRQATLSLQPRQPTLPLQQPLQSTSSLHQVMSTTLAATQHTVGQPSLVGQHASAIQQYAPVVRNNLGQSVQQLLQMPASVVQAVKRIHASANAYSRHVHGSGSVHAVRQLGAHASTHATSTQHVLDAGGSGSRFPHQQAPACGNSSSPIPSGSVSAPPAVVRAGGLQQVDLRSASGSEGAAAGGFRLYLPAVAGPGTEDAGCSSSQPPAAGATAQNATDQQQPQPQQQREQSKRLHLRLRRLSRTAAPGDAPDTE